MPIRPIKRDAPDAPDMYANVNPRPRRPPPPPLSPANDDAAGPATTHAGTGKGGRKRVKNDKSKWESTGEHITGDCRPPVSGQFKPGNPGGPGRPSKSLNQDTILRNELEEKRTIAVDGQPKKLSNRELLAKLSMKAAIEGEHRTRMYWLDVSDRLYPNPAAMLEEQETLADDQAMLGALLAAMSMGSPAGSDEAEDPCEPLDSEEEGFWDDAEDRTSEDDDK